MKIISYFLVLFNYLSKNFKTGFKTGIRDASFGIFEYRKTGFEKRYWF
jgi:hypothetical protein